MKRGIEAGEPMTGRRSGSGEGRGAMPATGLRAPLAAIAAALLAAGCSFAPVHERPVAPVAAEWRDAAAVQRAGAAAEAQAVAAADIGWREFYAEPALQELIARALEHNRDLRMAVLNIEAARAQYGIQRADRLPGIGAGASATRQRVPADLSPSGSSRVAEQYDATIGISAFELDFFGRVRNLGEAALAEYLATAEARRAAQIALVAQVAGTWVSGLAASEQLALLDRTLQAREDSLRLIRLRYDGGAASELEVRQAEGLVESARADRADAQRDRLQARNALELLVGQPVDDASLGVKPLAAVALPQAPAAGLPSALLERRPDILAAEERLRGASASIGAARAAFFPRITLTGAVGTASSDLDGLFGGGSGIWSFLPRITLPIFDGGRNQAGLDLAEVRRDLAVAGYEKTVQLAFREVADALAARSTIGSRLAARQAQVAAAARSLELAELRYRGGVDSQLQWLDAQRSLLGAEQALLGARVAQAANLVELYKVLGGGWLERSPAAAPAAGDAKGAAAVPGGQGAAPSGTAS
ncbi:AdeC/AdeK/OprM family multidrug efflux complex outer membrane factor [Quisquiliibacterium transsilvanicum]|uniref:Multidrug efflux system outer membrane protein n=2 Tax=Quisquiliibacterium transsilvanicum TaxID=1549638 RepID=A0A7W8HK23_9BURK|nr:multidrug efflux system outer membrane protein [Quisquiliibacterium transsilvanicum]